MQDTDFSYNSLISVKSLLFNFSKLYLLLQYLFKKLVCYFFAIKHFLSFKFALQNKFIYIKKNNENLTQKNPKINSTE